MPKLTLRIGPTYDLLARLWHHISKRRQREFLLLVLSSILASCAELLSIGAVLPFISILTKPELIFRHHAAKPIVDFFGFTSSNQLILPLTALFCSATLVAVAMRMFVLWASTRFSFAFGSDLSNDAYRRTLYQPYSVHIARNSSIVINSIWGKISEVIFYILLPTMLLINASVIVVIISAALLIAVPSIALIALAALGSIYILIVKATKRRLAANSILIAEESSNVVKNLQEGLGGIRDILIDGSQESFCNTYRETNKVLRRAQGNNQIMSQGPRYILEGMGMLLIAVLAYVLARQPSGIGTAIPMLAAIALGLQRILPATQQIFAAWSTIHGAHASLDDVLALLSQPLLEAPDANAAHPLTFRREIALKNLAFRYGLEKPWIFRNLNITITKGSRTGFIGETGCGKSTLLDIIMGLLQPSEGEFLIDGQPISTTNQRAWQQHIAHVPQNIFLADCSVTENIAFGIAEELIDFERVKLAASQAQLDSMIETLPHKYQTNVGERGVQLSGGQRQRVGIARALYKEANVIILDEATSALDTMTEAAVMQAIDRMNKGITILIIAHRLNTLDRCDQIFEVTRNGIRVRIANAPV